MEKTQYECECTLPKRSEALKAAQQRYRLKNKDKTKIYDRKYLDKIYADEERHKIYLAKKRIINKNVYDKKIEKILNEKMAILNAETEKLKKKCARRGLTSETNVFLISCS